MTDLIERLEKATGPDRELDGAIFWMAKRPMALRYFFSASPGMPHPVPAELPERGLGRHSVVHASPYYTASIDAALTLVPEAMDWSWLKFHRRVDDCGCFLGSIDTAAATPAIALCIAALRARALVTV